MDLYTGDLYGATCPPRWVRLSKEGLVLYRVVANSGLDKDLYAMKGEASLGLRCKRAPVPPHRLLQERGAKPVRL